MATFGVALVIVGGMVLYWTWGKPIASTTQISGAA